MLQPGSLQKPYTLCSQYDDALDLPAVPDLADDADEKAVAARDAAQAERDQKLKVARERSEWAVLVKPGRKPTSFTFGQVSRRQLNWFLAETERNKLSHIQSLELLFRLAFRAVDNLGDFRPEFVEQDEHSLLAPHSLDFLYSLADGKVVLELASVVMARVLRGVSPLS